MKILVTGVGGQLGYDVCRRLTQLGIEHKGVDVQDFDLTNADAVMDAVVHHTAAKGDVLGVARVAGIMAVKRTSELIPMCHPLMLGKCSVDFRLDREQCEVEAICTASLKGQTGVEMEALTGVSVALLTIYDMCKAIDKRMEITGIHLAKKTGGKSGLFINDPEFEGESGDA